MGPDQGTPFQRLSIASAANMGKLIFKRLLDLGGVLLGVSILVFLMIRLIPGDTPPRSSRRLKISLPMFAADAMDSRWNGVP